MSKYFNALILFTLIFSSCSTKKDILYIQDFDKNESIPINYLEYKLKVDDILKISITTEIPEAALVFDPNAINPNISNTKDALLFSGFQISPDGFIYFQNLGEIKAIGLTLNELRESLYNKIVELQLLTNPAIDIKILNSEFTIIGEVLRPGKYEFLENNLNIFEAIGMAGDLTINGKRNDIKLIREIEGERKIINLDLTSYGFLKSNDKYQIFPGDIILVNPNTTRIKNAGIIGNSGTLLSLLSFILSSIIVISR